MDFNKSIKFCEQLKDSNYFIYQHNGQRIYSLRKKPHVEPGKGCELFIGRVPRDMNEDELVPLFSQIAPIYELRLMVNFFGTNRGYCFVRYFTREAAERAIRLLNQFQVRADCRLGVYWSLDNTRLFIGGIPKDKTKREIMDELENYMENVKDIIMYPAYDNYMHNRGYAFIEFPDHRSAAIARRRIPPGTLMWNSPIKVDWADPLPEPDSEIMSVVDTLYLRNIPIALTNEELARKLRRVVRPDLFVKVRKSRDYAFVHFISRAAAEQALKLLENFTICEQVIEVTWARPQSFCKKNSEQNTPDHFCLSLPAKSRWLIKQKNLQRQALSEISRDCAGCSGLNSPLIYLDRVQLPFLEYNYIPKFRAETASSGDSASCSEAGT